MNNKLGEELFVDEEFHNKRVDYWIKKKIPTLSYPLICKIIRKGKIKVNKKKITNSFLLKKGDSIRIFFEIESSPLVKTKKIDQNFIKIVKRWIIYKDENIIAFNKPSGFAVQGGSKINISLDDVLEFLNFKLKDRPKLVHRLDKNTSGLLIVSRNTPFTQYLGKLFKNRKIKKKYLLFVNGSLDTKKGMIDLPVINNEKKLLSLTYFVVLKKKENFSLILAYPVTGRKNQLRRHFSGIGHPIIGEEKYHINKSDEIRSDQFFLHSLSLEFNDQKRQIKLFASPPNYFIEKMDQINFSLQQIKMDKDFKNLNLFVRVNV